MNWLETVNVSTLSGVFERSVMVGECLWCFTAAYLLILSLHVELSMGVLELTVGEVDFRVQAVLFKVQYNVWLLTCLSAMQFVRTASTAGHARLCSITATSKTPCLAMNERERKR